MDVFDPSLLPAGNVPHSAAPSLAVVDRNDLAMRIRNYRKSCDACPSGWQTYFEVLMVEMERQMPH